MAADGVRADAERVADLLLRVVLDEEGEHLALARREPERVGALGRRGRPDGVEELAGDERRGRRPALGDLGDGAHDGFRAGVLEEVAARPGLDGREQPRLVLEHGQHHHLHAGVLPGERRRRLDAVGAGHLDVHQDDLGERRARARAHGEVRAEGVAGLGREHELDLVEEGELLDEPVAQRRVVFDEADERGHGRGGERD